MEQMAEPVQGTAMGTGSPIIIGVLPVVVLLSLIFAVKFRGARKK